MTMKPSQAAVHAAKKVKAWGLYAAMRYAMNQGSSFAQFHIAERYEQRRRLRASFRGYLA